MGRDRLPPTVLSLPTDRLEIPSSPLITPPPPYSPPRPGQDAQGPVCGVCVHAPPGSVTGELAGFLGPHYPPWMPLATGGYLNQNE